MNLCKYESIIIKAWELRTSITRMAEHQYKLRRLAIEGTVMIFGHNFWELIIIVEMIHIYEENY